MILPDAEKAGADFWTELADRKTARTWGVKKDLSIAKHSDAPLPALSPSDGERVAEGRVRGDWLYLETITPPCALWIAGAGHIAQAVAPLARQLDFAVTVFDDRPALASHECFTREFVLQVDDWSRLLALPLPDVPSFGLIVTRGHKHDALVLETWIHRPFVFLGMIGSQRKARTIFDHFRTKNLATEAQLQRVACPVGLPIQSQSVPEIAVSILAQFIEKRAELVCGKQGASAAKLELV